MDKCDEIKVSCFFFEQLKKLIIKLFKNMRKKLIERSLYKLYVHFINKEEFLRDF